MSANSVAPGAQQKRPPAGDSFLPAEIAHHGSPAIAAADAVGSAATFADPVDVYSRLDPGMRIRECPRREANTELVRCRSS